MNTETDILIRSITQSDQSWMTNLVEDRWGSNRVVTRGIIHEIKQLPGFIALFSGDRIGLLTYFISIWIAWSRKLVSELRCSQKPESSLSRPAVIAYG
jgi:hypothetical protein